MTNARGIKMLTNKHLSACVTRDLALSPGTAQLQPYTPDVLQALGNASTLSCPVLPLHTMKVCGFYHCQGWTLCRGYKEQKYLGQGKDKLNNLWNLSSQMAEMHPCIQCIIFQEC